MFQNRDAKTFGRLLLPVIVMAALLQFFILDGLEPSFHRNLLDSGISALLLTVILFAVKMIFRFYKPAKSVLWYRLGIAVILAGLYCLTLDNVLKMIWPHDELYLAFLTRSMHTRFVFSLLIILLVDQNIGYQQLLETEREKSRRVTETEQLAVKAELDALRQQMQPHFLFNSLNSISALLADQPEKARAMIQQLSDFLRGTLKRNDYAMQDFRDEMQHLELYLAIEKIRFGERLDFHIDTDDACMDLKIPPLILQPVVENAIKFGLYETLGVALIAMDVRRNQQMLEIRVCNPFDADSYTRQQGTGFGFNAVSRRLYLLFGRNDLLTTQSKGNEFTTILKIPQ